MNNADPTAKKARTVFDHSVETLDTASANRLRLMRRDTLAAAAVSPASSRFNRWWIPAAGFTALVLALSINLFFTPNSSDTNFSDFDTALILSEDETDAEMLNWLADAPVEVSTAAKGNL
jgi:hypothetical protein